MKFETDDLMSHDNIIGIAGHIEFAPEDKPQTTKIDIQYLEETLNILKTLRLTSVYVTVVNASPLLFRGKENATSGISICPLDE